MLQVLHSICNFLFLIILLSALGASPTQAQKMYKCANTYSQIPCDKDSEPTKVFKDTRSQIPPGLRGRELCKLTVPQTINLKDPYSARVETIGEPILVTIKYADVPILSKRHDVGLNAKNSYGAYVGIRIYFCFLSEDETRLLRVEGPVS